jgi:hypothetical protein
VTDDVGNRFIFHSRRQCFLYSSTSCHENCGAKANPGLYLPMALAVTFPFNFWNAYIPVYYSKFLKGIVVLRNRKEKNTNGYGK